MFTGIVEEAGTVEQITPGTRSIRLVVQSNLCGRGLAVGDSLAVNGCCLTVAKLSRRARARRIEFDLLQETWDRTNFRQLVRGAPVNLERSLAANGRLGGHFVTGHIDATGRITRWEQAGSDHLLEITAPPQVMRYVVFKGSIAVDGISLTVAAVTKSRFRLWIIPHTFAVTSLRNQRVGNLVNLEADMLGKYVERFLAARTTPVRA